MSTDAENVTSKKPWATIILGLIVAAIFLTIIFSYQVEERETALVVTTSKVSDTPVGPGWHFRWPYPIQKIVKFDNRFRIFDGNVGQLEETMTKDKHNVIAAIFAIYRIKDPVTFYRKLVDITSAEENLNTWMRSTKTETFGRYNFNQLVNVDPEKMQLTLMEKEMTEHLSKITATYGLEIKMVGIKAINIPESVTTGVFERMKSERQAEAAIYRSQGESEAKIIRTNADTKASNVLAEAEAEAHKIRAKGDAEAAQFYAAFKQDPQLASFLRKLEALRRVMKDKTTLILDTNTAPFDVLKVNSDSLEQPKAAKQ
jgi:membrane protease subunit HflC